MIFILGVKWELSTIVHSFPALVCAGGFWREALCLSGGAAFVILTAPEQPGAAADTKYRAAPGVCGQKEKKKKRLAFVNASTTHRKPLYTTDTFCPPQGLICNEVKKRDEIAT